MREVLIARMSLTLRKARGRKLARMDQIREQSVPAGKTVYKEGDPGEAVYIIAEGKVEVLRKVGRSRVRLAVLGKGSLFGEAGVIRNTQRSTTVRALVPVDLMVIPKPAFDSVFKQDNPLALTLLRALCDRLAQADMKLLQHRIYNDGAPVEEVRRMRLLADSPEVLAQIGSEGLIVEDLPFRVGRHLYPGETASADQVELMLRALQGAQISPLHFAIENCEGRLIVRDLASHLGTLVNRNRIGHFEEFSTADLRFGSTPIQAGGLDSPYRFLFVAERGES